MLVMHLQTAWQVPHWKLATRRCPIMHNAERNRRGHLLRQWQLPDAAQCASGVAARYRDTLGGSQQTASVRTRSKLFAAGRGSQRKAYDHAAKGVAGDARHCGAVAVALCLS